MAEIILLPDNIVEASEGAVGVPETELSESIPLLTDSDNDTGILLTAGNFIVSIENTTADLDNDITVKVLISSMDTKGTVTTSIGFGGEFVDIDSFSGLASGTLREIEVTLTNPELEAINEIFVKVASNVDGTLIGDLKIVVNELKGGAVTLNRANIISSGKVTI